jgi:hypothetical protein
VARAKKPGSTDGEDSTEPTAGSVPATKRSSKPATAPKDKITSTRPADEPVKSPDPEVTPDKDAAVGDPAAPKMETEAAKSADAATKSPDLDMKPATKPPVTDTAAPKDADKDGPGTSAASKDTAGPAADLGTDASKDSTAAKNDAVKPGDTKDAGAGDKAAKPAGSVSKNSASDTLVSAAVAEKRGGVTPPPSQSSAQPDPEPKSRPEPRRESSSSRSRFWPLLLGGLLAGAIGFALAEANFFGMRDNGEAALQDNLAQQGARLDALESAEPAAAVDPAAVEELSASLAALQDRLGALDQFDERLTAVERRPTAEGEASAEALSALEGDVTALRQSVEEQRDQIAQLRDTAQQGADTTRLAALQTALTAIRSAIAEGRPFADELAALNEAGAEEVPEALTSTADTGLATLNSLQSQFPDTARAGLSAARANGEDAESGNFTSFLRRQLGARSVAPREGDDPDAVLSRAEAAVRAGDLEEALAEIDKLSEPTRSAMEDWLAPARARQGATAAVADLSARLTAEGN